MIHLLVTALCVFPVFLVVYIFNQRVLHRLSSFPGPVLASLTNWWRVYHELVGDLPFIIHDLHKKHGPYVRIAPDELSTVSPGYVDKCLRGGRFWQKSTYYDGSGGIKPNVFSTRDEDFHAMRRRQMSNGFAASTFRKMERIFDSHCERMMNTLEKSQEKGAAVSLDDLFKMYSQDVNGEVSFSKDTGLLMDMDETEGLKNLPPMNSYQVVAKCYGYVPGLRTFVQAYGMYIPIVKDVLKSRGMLIGQVIMFAKKEYEKRRVLGVEKSFDEKDEGRVNLLTSLALAADPETGEELGVVDVAGEAVTFMVAGSHSTAAAIDFTFACLVRDKEVMDKVEKEIKDNLPVQKDKTEEYDGLENKLPYLSAVLKEVFRMYPTVNHPLARIVPPGEPFVDEGATVPSGTTIGGVAYAYHRNPEIWGYDAEVFKPERWMEEDYRRQKERYLLHFGQGHRACMGRNMALITIWKAVVGILQRYDVQPVGKIDGDASHVPMIGRGFADLKEPLIVKLVMKN